MRQAPAAPSSTAEATPHAGHAHGQARPQARGCGPARRDLGVVGRAGFRYSFRYRLFRAMLETVTPHALGPGHRNFANRRATHLMVLYRYTTPCNDIDHACQFKESPARGTVSAPRHSYLPGCVSGGLRRCTSTTTRWKRGIIPQLHE